MADERKARAQGPGFFGWLKRLLVLLLLAGLGYGGWWYYQSEQEKEVLQRMIARLTAETRVADVWVEAITRDESGDRDRLRLKILEYDVDGKPLTPVYCTFALNDVIHFEALVIRLSNELVKDGEGKSIHLFRRAFALDEASRAYESCELNRPDQVPGGYRLPPGDRRAGEIERRYWQSFWKYALDEQARAAAGVRNAQVEAPATRFKPDQIYRLSLEAAGGLTISASPVPEILKGEHVRKIEHDPRPEQAP